MLLLSRRLRCLRRLRRLAFLLLGFLLLLPCSTGFLPLPLHPPPPPLPTHLSASSFTLADRIESAKAAVLGGVGGAVASTPLILLSALYLHSPNAVGTWEFQTDMAALQGALFGIVYRYVVRTKSDFANKHLRSGVTAAFSLANALPQIAVPATCSTVPLQCGWFYILDPQTLPPLLWHGASAFALFAAAAAAVEAGISRGVIAPRTLEFASPGAAAGGSLFKPEPDLSALSPCTCARKKGLLLCVCRGRASAGCCRPSLTVGLARRRRGLLRSRLSSWARSKKRALLLWAGSPGWGGRERSNNKTKAQLLFFPRMKMKALMLFCSSAAEAGRVSGCRGETPRTPPAAGEVALVPARFMWRTRPPELARTCARFMWGPQSSLAHVLGSSGAPPL
jgi:hypothetical protein